MRVLARKLHKDAQLPARASSLAGGWDLTAVRIEEETQDSVIVHTGLAMRPESPRFKITIVPRSSLTTTGWVMANSPALIDPDYTGEIKLRFRAIPQFSFRQREDYPGSPLFNSIDGFPPFPYAPGERVAQMYLEEIISIEFKEVDELEETARGAGGFGSTGK